MRDSANKNVTIINSEDPNVDLCDIKLLKEIKDSLAFQLFICLENATSYNIDIKLDLLSNIITSNQYFSIYKNVYFISPNTTLNKGKYSSIKMSIPNLPFVSIYFFRIFGTFKKFDGKVILIDRLYAYDMNERHFGTPNEQVYNEVQRFIHSLK